MKKNLGIIPTIYERRHNLNIIIEKRTYEFLRQCFKNYNIITLDNCHKFNLDVIVSLGGNSLYSLEKNASNLYREKLDKFYLKKSLKKNIPFLGICHGAQYVANYFKSEIKKKKNHTRINHLIKFFYEKKIKVNSYHDYSVIKLGKNLEKIAWTDDGSIEAFKHKKKKIFCIMWHPERYKQIKKFDLKFIRKYL